MSIELSDRNTIKQDDYRSSRTALFSENPKSDQTSKELEKNLQKRSFQIEKVTRFRFFLFTLYTASLLVILSLRNDFPVLLDINRTLRVFYCNEELHGDSFTALNTTKPVFSGIQDVQGVISFLNNTIIYGLER